MRNSHDEWTHDLLVPRHGGWFYWLSNISFSVLTMRKNKNQKCLLRVHFPELTLPSTHLTTPCSSQSSRWSLTMTSRESCSWCQFTVEALQTPLCVSRTARVKLWNRYLKDDGCIAGILTSDWLIFLTARSKNQSECLNSGFTRRALWEDNLVISTHWKLSLLAWRWRSYLRVGRSLVRCSKTL